MQKHESYSAPRPNWIVNSPLLCSLSVCVLMPTFGGILSSPYMLHSETLLLVNNVKALWGPISSRLDTFFITCWNCLDSPSDGPRGGKTWSTIRMLLAPGCGQRWSHSQPSAGPLPHPGITWVIWENGQTHHILPNIKDLCANDLCVTGSTNTQ